jgi:EAL domain-containing protein (putative c-di-GMP-specific phosphodiesterase class I)/GGDEF domain-containing protein
MLEYPLALIIGAGAVGAAAAGAVWGRRSQARSLARALSGLDEVAQGIARGEGARVATPTRPEMAGLAASFNAMADAVEERERVTARLAMSDPETGLPDRRALEAELAALAASGEPGVVAAAVSVEGFAALRGAIGHERAAALLGDVAQRLAAKAPAAMVGRLSPDTLGMVFAAGGAKAAEAATAALAAELEGPAALGETSVDVALTFGVATAAETAGERSALVRAAVAMDAARTAGRRVGAFDAAAYGDPAANLALMAQMGRAIETGQLQLHHQPKYDIRQGRTVGIEALVRWTHPTRGLLGPGVFVRLAEATGHIRALTDHVLATAIADQAALRRAGYEQDVSINITARLLADAGFVEQAIRQAGAAQGRVWLEVTETALAGDPERALRHVERLAEAGIGVSIDDFGAGPLSLARLRGVRAEEVKISQSLILDVADDRRNTRLVRAAIELAHGLGMKVAAKGVETNEVYALLASMGCDFAQGFLIERPMLLADLLAFLAEDRATRRFG